LATPDQICDEVVHLAHVAAQVPAEHRILRRLAQRLHPELGELELRRPDGDVPLADGLDRCARVFGLLELPLPGLPDRHVLERGEVEVGLRGEVPVQDRLRDAAARAIRQSWCRGSSPR
jgi:hypothetical protein